MAARYGRLTADVASAALRLAQVVVTKPRLAPAGRALIKRASAAPSTLISPRDPWTGRTKRGSFASLLLSTSSQPPFWITNQATRHRIAIPMPLLSLSVNYGALQAIGGVSMFDFHHDWKAWSDKERTTVAALAAGLALIVAAWMVV
jgi:hypothetical protein